MKNEQTEQANVIIITEKRTKSKLKPLPKLTLKVSTWLKQSHGLYDYQSAPQKQFEEEFCIQQSSRVFRNLISRKTIVREMTEEVKQLPDRIQILNLKYEPIRNHYILKNCFCTQLSSEVMDHGKEREAIVEKQKLFVSVNQTGAGHKLEVGDFIKLGRVELIVIEINNGKKTESLDFDQVYGSKQYIFHLKDQLEGACKICLSDQFTEDDPLVNPCNCKGTCGVIHLDCLKNWINNKVKREIVEKARTYNFQKFECELCKAPFPSVITLENGKHIELLNFEKPQTPYVMLEQCSQTEQKQAKTIHFIFPDEGNRVNIGRGQQSELLISDISVSRNHSVVAFGEENFYIYDSGSKFGTLVEMKHDITVTNTVRLQHNGCSIVIQPKEKKREGASRSKKKSNEIPQ